jgi:hypothetical protein
MNTSRITIRRTHGPDVAFEGKLVARAEGPRNQPFTYGRWHEIAVYARADGMWVVQIDFGTLCVRELPHTDVEIVDRPDDVETVLLFYSPTEHLNMRWIRPRYENDKRRFLKGLRENYDSRVNRVVHEMHPHIEAFQTQPRAEQPPRTTRWQGLLELIGLR